MGKAIIVHDAYVNLDKVRDDVTVVAIIEDVKSDKAYRSVVLEDKQIVYTSLSKGAQQFNKKKWRTDIKITDCGAGNSIPIVKLIQRSHQENVLKGYPEVDLWELPKFQEAQKNMSDEEQKQAAVSYRHIKDIMQLRRQSSKESRRQHFLWDYPVEVLYSDCTPRFCIPVADRMASIIHDNDMMVFMLKNSVDAVKLLERIIETDVFVKEVEVKRAASQRMRAMHSGNPMHPPNPIYSHSAHAQQLPASALLGGVGLLHSNPQPQPQPPHSEQLQLQLNSTGGVAGSARPGAVLSVGKGPAPVVPADIQKLIARRVLMQHYSSGGGGAPSLGGTPQPMPMPASAAAPSVQSALAATPSSTQQQEVEEEDGEGGRNLAIAAAVLPRSQPASHDRLQGSQQVVWPQGPAAATAGTAPLCSQPVDPRAAAADLAGPLTRMGPTQRAQHSSACPPQSSGRLASQAEGATSVQAARPGPPLMERLPVAGGSCWEVPVTSVPVPTPGRGDPPAPDPLISPAPHLSQKPGQPPSRTSHLACGLSTHAAVEPPGGLKRQMLTRAAGREQQQQQQLGPPAKRRKGVVEAGLGALAEAADALALEDQKQAAEAAAVACAAVGDRAGEKAGASAANDVAMEGATEVPEPAGEQETGKQLPGRLRQQQRRWSQRPGRDDALQVRGRGQQAQQEPVVESADGNAQEWVVAGAAAIPAFHKDDSSQVKQEEGSCMSKEADSKGREVVVKEAPEAALEDEGVLTASMLENMLATMNQLSNEKLAQAEKAKAALQQELEVVRGQMEEQWRTHDRERGWHLQQAANMQAENAALQQEVSRLREQLAAQQSESQQMAATLRKFWQQLKGSGGGGSGGAGSARAAAEGGAGDNRGETPRPTPG